jgi:dynein heavy chain
MPEDGVNVYGMYLEGAKWNPVIHSLDESDPKILFTKCPMMRFMPCKSTEFKVF